MDLKTILLYAAVILGSGALAWAVFGGKAEVPDEPATEATLDLIEDPIWYRNADERRRLDGMHLRLPLMTSSSIPPEQAGPTKDEIALLCAYHEDCADAFVAFVRGRSHPSAAEISSFMEVMARVRNPKFVSLLDLGLGHQAWEVRYNAADAAITQRDRRAVEALTEALMNQSGLEILRVIDALVRIGGDEALGTLAYGLQRNEPEIQKALLVPLAKIGYRPALNDVRRLLDGQNIEVRVLAAWAAMAMGQSEGRERLMAFARDSRMPGPPRAQATNLLGSHAMDRSDVQSLMRDLLADEDPVIRFEARLALAHIGDEAVLAAVLRDLASDLASERRVAIGTLASTGRDEDIALLESKIPAMNLEEFGVFLNGAGRGLSPRALPVISAYAKRDDRVGQMALSGFLPFGDAALPFLVELVNSLTNRVLKHDALGAIAAIESEAARSALESFDFSDSREFWRAQRIHLRRVDLALAPR